MYIYMYIYIYIYVYVYVCVYCICIKYRFRFLGCMNPCSFCFLGVGSGCQHTISIKTAISVGNVGSKDIGKLCMPSGWPGGRKGDGTFRK